MCRDAVLQEGKGIFAVYPQLLSLSPAMERESQSSPLGWETKEGLGWMAQIWGLLTDPWKVFKAVEFAHLPIRCSCTAGVVTS